MTATTAADASLVVEGVGGGTSRSRGEELFEFVRDGGFTR